MLEYRVAHDLLRALPNGALANIVSSRLVRHRANPFEVSGCGTEGDRRGSVRAKTMARQFELLHSVVCSGIGKKWKRLPSRELPKD